MAGKTTAEAIGWFNAQFGEAIDEAVQGTPFDRDLIAAIGFQETGYLWRKLIDTLDADEILKLCVGDTLDAPNRDAFPRTKADLISYDRGQEMFDTARAALEAISAYDESYGKVARNNPNKFCHGYGVFQYDIQFFEEDAEFFLQKKWYSFEACVAKLVNELKEALRRIGWSSKTTLSDEEKVYVAIAYNAGHVDPARGFKQGYQSDDGRYYGENIADFLKTAKATPPAASSSPEPV
jgi:hypothetical protein